MIRGRENRRIDDIETESQLSRPYSCDFWFMYELIPLQQLAAGSVALVGQVLGRPEQVHRARELGFRDGAEIRMVRSGTPCIVRLGSQTLCLRGNESLHVLVRPGAVA